MGIIRALIAGLFLVGCANETYTLYRSSPVGADMRIHVGSFDAKDSDANYNRENCQIAADLFAKQPGVTVKYWCEKGAYKK